MLAPSAGGYISRRGVHFVLSNLEFPRMRSQRGREVVGFVVVVFLEHMLEELQFRMGKV